MLKMDFVVLYFPILRVMGPLKCENRNRVRPNLNYILIHKYRGQISQDIINFMRWGDAQPSKQHLSRKTESDSLFALQRQRVSIQ